MIECRSYGLDELKEILHISIRQWVERKDDVLEHLKIFFDYTISPVGRGYIVDIHKQYAEYLPLPRRDLRENPITYYQNLIKEEIEIEPRNSPLNIAKLIEAKGLNKYNMPIESIAAFARPIITINEPSYWMKLDEQKLIYIPLSKEEQIQFDQIQKNSQMTERIFELYQEKIPKKELIEQLFILSEEEYENIMIQCKEQMGFTPVNVSLLGIKEKPEGGETK